MRLRTSAAAALLLLASGPALMADVADWARGTDPNALAAPALRGGSQAHPLGTDALGRDQLSRLFHAGRVSLTVALGGAVLAFLLGAAVGCTAGYAGGLWEQVLMRATETAMAVPKLPLMLLLSAAEVPTQLGFQPDPWMSVVALIVIIGTFSWMDVARLTRAATRELRARAFVQAAEGLGLSPLEVLRRHILPHLVPPLGVALALDIGENILYESSLSFLGLGVSAPTPSWGALLARGLSQLHENPLMVVLPGLFTLSAVVGLHLLAEEARLRAGLDRRRQR